MQHLQLIITLLIISVAAFLAVRPLFKKKKKTEDDCNTCSSSCGGCPVADLKSRHPSSTTGSKKK